MTALVCLLSPQGYAAQARALLNSASSTLFISERLSQHLQLSHIEALCSDYWDCWHVTWVQLSINCPVSGLTSMVTWGSVQCESLSSPMGDLWSSNPSCVHRLQSEYLDVFRLADPRFHMLGRVDLPLEVDVSSSMLKAGRLSGPPGNTNRILRMGFSRHCQWSSSINYYLTAQNHSSTQHGPLYWRPSPPILGDRGKRIPGKFHWHLRIRQC